MQQVQSVHSAEVDQYNPPQHVSNHLALHAIRNIPHSTSIQERIRPQPHQNILMGLTPHKYNSTGLLQFGFIN
jgi:hypothetical protein